MSQVRLDLKPLNQIISRLCGMFVQRESEVVAVVTSLISGEPSILVGAPGTGKTALIESLARLINGRYFYYLLTRFTEPDELLGVIDVNALREGKYVRITANRLPEADVVFLDEIFKASSAIRNILLDIILNKRYLNGVEYRRIPALTFYSASNEISYDSEDQAFYDRMTIRTFVKNVSSDMWAELLIKGIELYESKESLTPVCDTSYIRAIQGAVMVRAKSLAHNESFRNKYLEALSELSGKGIKLSDRRKVKALIVASAISIIYAEDDASLDSLADALRLVAPHDEDDLVKVEEVINICKLSNAYDIIQQVNTLATELRRALNEVKSKTEDQITISDYNKLRTLVGKAFQVVSRFPKNPRYTSALKPLLEAVSDAKHIMESIRGG